MDIFVQKLYSLAYRLSGDTCLARELCLETAAVLGHRGLSLEASNISLEASRMVASLMLNNPPYRNHSLQFAADDPSAGLQAALNSLPVEERVAVILRDYCGLSYGEVGLILGRDKREIGQLLSAGRFSIRRWLEEEKGA